MAPALVASPADLIEYRIEDSSTVEPNAKKGYSERFIHSEMFKRFPDVNCVVHSHAEDVLPYVVSGVPLKAVYHMAGFLGKFGSLGQTTQHLFAAIDTTTGSKVPVYDIAPLYSSSDQQDMLVNNQKFGSALAAQFASSDSSSIPGHAVVLMRKHDFTTQAHSIETAVYRAIYTKINAKAQSDSLAVLKNFGSEGRMFDPGDLGMTEDQCKGCSIMNEQYQEKPWRFWVRETENRGMYVNRLA